MNNYPRSDRRPHPPLCLAPSPSPSSVPMSDGGELVRGGTREREEGLENEIEYRDREGEKLLGSIDFFNKKIIDWTTT